jgi:dihydroflavonol-4-reductase
METATITKEKILVTGGTGFIGRHLVEALVERGYNVRCLVRKNSDLGYLSKLSVEFVYGDMTDKTSLLNAVQDVTTVFHLAGIIGKWGVPEETYWNIHVRGTEFLLDSCIERRVKRLIYCSSAGVLGPIKKPPANEDYPYNPSNIYEKVKAEAEKMVLNYKEKLDVTVIRPEFVYGPGDMHVLKLFNSIQKAKFYIIGNGESLLHPTYVDDLIHCFLSCLENKNTIGEVYLVVGETPVKVKDLVRIIAEELGVSPPKVHFPASFAFALAYLSEFLGRVFNFNPRITLSQVKFFTQHRAFDGSKAKRDFGYKPIELRQGVRQAICWYRQNGYLLESGRGNGLSIKTAYYLAKVEEEGLGTAYEYIMKKKLLKKLVDTVGSPKSILVAGLPEKYGFSLDFVHFGEYVDAEVVVVDERTGKLSTFSQILSRLKDEGFFPQLNLTALLLSNWHEINVENEMFDLVISCEVLQRLSAAERIAYMRRLGEIANASVFFVPNAENTAHAKISKLHALKLEELKNLCVAAGYELLDYGYVDMPPFPPGLKQKKKNGDERKDTKLELLTEVLNLWSMIERYIPYGIVKKQSHIVYFIGRKR